MVVYICLDDNNGISFNNRRQSRDSAVISCITDMAKGSKLFMSNYSAKLFADCKQIDIVSDDSYLEFASADDHVFVENASLLSYGDKITKIVIFKWNKIYPSDRKFDLSLSRYTLSDSFDIKGTSHDKITCEVWVK